MQILVIGFFSVFFVSSFIGVVMELKTIFKKNKEVKIELYNNGELSTDLSNMYAGRLADTSIRSSVRYHNSLYKTKTNYEDYRNAIRKLELP